MTKDEMKNRISMALKDTNLQQGFEIICKNLTELEKDLNYQKQARTIAENAVVELEKENAKLKKVKELINKMLYEYKYLCLIDKETIADAEQFIKECEEEND